MSVVHEAGQPSSQAFSSRSHDLARNFVTSPNGIPRERVSQGPYSVTSRHFVPSRVEWAGGERLGTRLEALKKSTRLPESSKLKLPGQ